MHLIINFNWYFIQSYELTPREVVELVTAFSEYAKTIYLLKPDAVQHERRPYRDMCAGITENASNLAYLGGYEKIYKILEKIPIFNI